MTTIIKQFSAWTPTRSRYATCCAEAKATAGTSTLIAKELERLAKKKLAEEGFSENFHEVHVTNDPNFKVTV